MLTELIEELVALTKDCKSGNDAVTEREVTLRLSQLVISIAYHLQMIGNECPNYKTLLASRK